MTYSATVSAYFATPDGDRLTVAKTNHRYFYLADPINLPPGTRGDLVVIVDGDVDGRPVVLPDGAVAGELVRYVVE
jgi:hypothetical protein